MTNPAADAWDPRLYDDRHAFVWKHGASLVELLAPQPGERILDLGCGTGHLTARIADAGAEVVGIDASPAMIEEARRNFAGRPRLRFEVADARTFARAAELAAEIGRFDAVFSNAVLHWVRPPEDAVRAIRAALRPGGRFVAEFGGRGNCARVIEALRSSLAEFAGEDRLPPWYYPSVAEYSTLLEREGLETVTALLFERPTKLEGSVGLRDWARMFATDAVASVPESSRESFFNRVESIAGPALFQQGDWFADYRRLRIVARASAGDSN
jgi:trans-aconitate 2-methyltransferase